MAALVGGALCWTAQPPLAAQHAAHGVARAAALALRVSVNPSMVMTAAPITRDGVAPAGPDPYKLVRDDLDYIKASIKQMLSANKGEGASIAKNEVLTMAAREFSQRKGKSFRPMLVLLIGRATSPDFMTDVRHFKLGVISEMIHTASLIHADVLEENADMTDSSQGTLVHQEVALDVGNKVCILAGDFLLSKAAVELSLLDNSDVTELVARGLEAICEGGMMVSDNSRDAADAGVSLEKYMGASVSNTAQLIGNSCHSSSILSGHKVDSTVAQACLMFGEELALAQQLVTEAEEMTDLLKACRRNPRKKWPQGFTPTAPLLIASDTYPLELRPIIARSYSEPADAAQTIELIDRSRAIFKTLQMAGEHAQAAAEALEVLPSSSARDALYVLCYKVLSGSPIK